MRKTNYHMHTKRCMHASGSDEEYVLAAIEEDMKKLDFLIIAHGNMIQILWHICVCHYPSLMIIINPLRH